MPAAWQATGTLLGSTGADITPVIPTHAIGDLLFVIAASRNTTETLTTPSGWTPLSGPTDTTNWRTYVCARRATSAAMTDPLLDWSAATGEKYGQVHTVRGANTLGDVFSFSAATGAIWNFAAGGDVTDTIATTAMSSVQLPGLKVVIGIGSDNASASMTSVTDAGGNTYDQRHYSTIATGSDATGWFFDTTGVLVPTTITCDFNSTMPAAGVFNGGISEVPVPPLVTARARS
jgi:hypothetical protein